MAIDPTGSALKTFMQAEDGTPVVMLNLLRFKPDGGRDSYLRYVEAFTPFAQKYGAEVLYVGDGLAPVVAEPGQEWDTVLLVRYPNRAAFSDMVRDPDYQQVTHLRTDALVEAVLQPTTEWQTRG